MKKYFISIISILIVIALILMLLLIRGCSKEEKKEYKSIIEIDGNTAVVEDQNLNGLKITNISFVLNDKESNVNLELLNDTNDLEYIENIIGYIYNSRDELISTVYLPVYYELKPSESVSLGLIVDCDMTNAKKIKFELEDKSS